MRRTWCERRTRRCWQVAPAAEYPKGCSPTAASRPSAGTLGRVHSERLRAHETIAVSSRSRVREPGWRARAARRRVLGSAENRRANRAPRCGLRVRGRSRLRTSGRCTPRHKTGKTALRRPGSAWRRSVCSPRLLSASMRRPRTCVKPAARAAARRRARPAARSDGAWQIPVCWMRSALARVACTAEASGARGARETAAVGFMSCAVAVRFQR